MGLNPAVAYLVLARFSDRANRVTAASVNAVEKYTNISRGRSQGAVRSLVEAKLITQTKGGSRPVYDLLPQRGTQMAGRTENAEQWIWLPNALVTGAAGEIPPVELVRQTQDAMALRLLVELYDSHNLREDGGVSRSVTYQDFSREKVGQQGPFVVWGFSAGSQFVCWGTPVTDCHDRKPTAEEKKAGKTNGSDFFLRLGSLLRLGLVEFVPHLFESEHAEAERLHPYRFWSGTGDAIESRIGVAADDAARSLLTEGQTDWADRDGLLLVPVYEHLASVALIGVARLRYLPRTSLTAAWFGDQRERGEKWLRHYEGIAQAAREGRSLTSLASPMALAS